MRPYLMLSVADVVSERPAGADDDVHFPEALVVAVFEEYTAPGDRVLDPFAGYGTTLVVAERMHRRSVGIELSKRRVDVIRTRLASDAEVVHGDARQLADLVTGPVDLCFTSPPYMNAVDHPQNPLNAYETDDGDYGVYLREIGQVFAQVATLLRHGGYVIINAANITTAGGVTPLAWDIAGVVSEHLTFRQESFLCWDQQPTWITGDYCMVFQKAGDAPARSRRWLGQQRS